VVKTTSFLDQTHRQRTGGLTVARPLGRSDAGTLRPTSLREDTAAMAETVKRATGDS
jgi:hypothetical protein